MRAARQRIASPADLAAELYECVPDAGDYDAVISDRIAAWWPTAPQADGERPRIANLTCRKTWTELAPTGDSSVRHGADCRQDIVQIRSIAEAVPLVGRCFAYRS